MKTLELYIPDHQLILYALHKCGSSRITDLEIRTNITYAHISNILKALVQKELVVKFGRNFYICTDKGNNAALMLEEYFIITNIDTDKIFDKKRKNRYDDKDIVEVLESLEEVNNENKTNIR